MHGTNIQNFTSQSPKTIDSAKSTEEVECVADAVPEEEAVCCKAEPEYEDSEMRKRRQACAMADSPSPTGSVISISSGSDEDGPDAQKHSPEWVNQRIYLTAIKKRQMTRPNRSIHSKCACQFSKSCQMMQAMLVCSRLLCSKIPPIEQSRYKWFILIWCLSITSHKAVWLLRM